MDLALSIAGSLVSLLFTGAGLPMTPVQGAQWVVGAVLLSLVWMQRFFR